MFKSIQKEYLDLTLNFETGYLNIHALLNKQEQTKKLNHFWLNKAYELGNPIARISLIKQSIDNTVFYEGYTGGNLGLATAYIELKDLAEHGYSPALIESINALLKDDYIKQDLQQAARIFSTIEHLYPELANELRRDEQYYEIIAISDSKTNLYKRLVGFEFKIFCPTQETKYVDIDKLEAELCVK